MSENVTDQSGDRINILGLNLSNVINSRCDKAKSISAFCKAPKSVPNVRFKIFL